MGTTTLAMLRCTNISPGSVPVILLAGTRLSEQPIHRYSAPAGWPGAGRIPGRARTNVVGPRTVAAQEVVEGHAEIVLARHAVGHGSTVPTFVLIPGAGGAAWFWHRLVPELEARGVDALPVEPARRPTRAQGCRSTPPRWSTAVGRRRPLVVVAQSLGGFTAPLVCERLDVTLLVLRQRDDPAPGRDRRRVVGGDRAGRGARRAGRAATGGRS